MSRSKKISYTTLEVTSDSISGIAATSYTNSEIQAFDQNGVTLTPVPEGDVIDGILTNPWTKGVLPIPYGSGDVANSYVSSGLNVYLNLGTNSYNDISKNDASSYEPTHSSGIHTYEDGHTWLLLYSIPANMTKFLGTYMPVAGFDILVDAVIDFETAPLSSNATVNCSFYQDNVLHSNMITTNSKCNEIKKALYNDTFDVKISSFGNTPPVGITTGEYNARFLELYNTNQIPRTHFAKPIYDNAITSGLSSGSIISAYIDINSIANTSVSPDITIGITGQSGTDGALSFLMNLGTTLADIIGIQIDGHGTSYAAPVELYISGSISEAQANDILDNIQLVVSGRSRYGFDLCDVFDAEHSLFGAPMVTIVNTQSLATSTLRFSSVIPSSGTVKLESIPTVVTGKSITTKSSQNTKSEGTQKYNTNTSYPRR